MRVPGGIRGLGVVALFLGFAGAEPRRVVLLEELVRLEALGARGYELPLPQQKAVLELRWSVKAPGGAVRIVVADTHAGSTVFDSGYASAGQHRVNLQQAGQYRLTVENRQQTVDYALVDLRLELDFGAEPAAATAPLMASPARRYGAIAGSLALFAMMVTYAGVRLAPTIWQRWGPRRYLPVDIAQVDGNQNDDDEDLRAV
jgi:hypothetical protein